MLLYEVNIQVEREIADAYRDWLERHVAEMLEIEGFLRAEIFEGDAPDGYRGYVSHYHLKNQAALDRYLAEDAPRMRADGTRRFGDKMQATRRVLHLHRSFGT